MADPFQREDPAIPGSTLYNRGVARANDAAFMGDVNAWIKAHSGTFQPALGPDGKTIFPTDGTDKKENRIAGLSHEAKASVHAAMATIHAHTYGEQGIEKHATAAPVIAPDQSIGGHHSR